MIKVKYAVDKINRERNILDYSPYLHFLYCELVNPRKCRIEPYFVEVLNNSFMKAIRYNELYDFHHNSESSFYNSHNLKQFINGYFHTGHDEKNLKRLWSFIKQRKHEIINRYNLALTEDKQKFFFEEFYDKLLEEFYMAKPSFNYGQVFQDKENKSFYYICLGRTKLTKHLGGKKYLPIGQYFAFVKFILNGKYIEAATKKAVFNRESAAPAKFIKAEFMLDEKMINEKLEPVDMNIQLV